eukprot:SAG22_NODE_536_length_9364_cov_15.973988_18_plen_94_part_00
MMYEAHVCSGYKDITSVRICDDIVGLRNFCDVIIIMNQRDLLNRELGHKPKKTIGTSTNQKSASISTVGGKCRPSVGHLDKCRQVPAKCRISR